MSRELILTITAKDFDETHIRGSGAGGQHRNKSHTGVRLVHRASGAVGEATDSREQHRNKTAAFQRLRETPEWKAWFRTAVALAAGRPSVESLVEKAMNPKNIRTQVLNDRSQWVDLEE
jgi:protein subunit release factor A